MGNDKKTVDHICAEEFNVELNRILSGESCRKVNRARWSAMVIKRKLTGETQKEIALFYGYLRQIVPYAEKRTNQLKKDDKQFLKSFNRAMGRSREMMQKI